MIEIAQRVGVTHSMINVYFGGKLGLLYEIVRENNEPQYAASVEVLGKDAPAFDRLSELLLLWARADCGDPRMLAIMQSYSWVWPQESEEENANDRARFKALLADLVRQGQMSGEVRDRNDPEATAKAIFAIYTCGLRGAVFGSLTTDQCHRNMIRQIELLL